MKGEGVFLQPVKSYRAAKLRFKIITRIALSATLAGGLLLLVAVLFFKNGQGLNYLHLMQSYTVTQKNLDSMLWIAGLFFIFCVGAASWCLALYFSFRMAGPLFRMARNLEVASSTRHFPDIRKRDCLQKLSQQLKASVSELHDHYAGITSQLDQLEHEFSKATPDSESIESSINSLKGQMHHVRLD